MIVFKPPTAIVCQKSLPKVFLAGTIDMGESVNWQADVENRLSDLDGYIFNPLRDYFDPSVIQSIHNPLFKEQVMWELTGLEFADIILMYFLPGSKSPISLLELGLNASSGKMIVYCPPGFWRKGNVDIVCEMYNIPVYVSVEDAINAVRSKIKCLG
jgi:Nucleoside 2-deoxyribosyltransferase like